MRTKYECETEFRIMVDLDGVLGQGGAFVHAHEFDMEPVPGAIEWLTDMAQTFEILIFTSRLCSEKHFHWGDDDDRDIEVMAKNMHAWFVKHGVPEDMVNKFVLYPPELGKPSAMLMIDDKGYRFEGDNFPSYEDVVDMHENIYWRKNNGTT